MNPQRKFAISMGAGFLAFLLLLAIGGSIMNSVGDQEHLAPDEVGDSEADTVSNQLWDDRNVEMLVLAVMVFASVLGILALVGGEFKWR